MNTTTSSLRFGLFTALASTMVLAILSCGTTHSTEHSLALPSPAQRGYFMGRCVSSDEDATEQTCQKLSDHLRYALYRRGMMDKSGKGGDKRIDLDILEFRNVSAFTRGMFGIMSGKDGLKVRVSVVDAGSAKTLGEFTVSTFNFTAVNTTEGTMIRDATKEIAAVLSGEKS